MAIDRGGLAQVTFHLDIKGIFRKVDRKRWRALVFVLCEKQVVQIIVQFSHHETA